MAPRVWSKFFGRRSSSAAANNKHNVEKVTADLTTEQQRRFGPVVVELFSSQGCSASTEAELVFSRVGRGDFQAQVEAPLILLAYHVDYWDYTGWKDPFGSSMWTVRQKAYVEALNLDTMFTPQIVVQGRTQCVADDPEAILSCITAAPRYPAPSFQATFQKTNPGALLVTLTGSLKSKVDHGGGDVVVKVALYECGLVTDCMSGANKGKVLANDYVVRRLEKLSSVGKDKKGTMGTVNFPLWEGFNPAKCGMAVFLEDSSHHIFGSQNFQLPANIV